MAISFSQPYELLCPSCQQPFAHETWVLVDAEERPDLAAALRDLTLHDTQCPGCGQSGVVDAPLLYHDRTLRQVMFAVPHAMDEAEWQEIAQGLLWMLIGALPREAQQAYLSNVQAEAGLAGVAHALAQAASLPQTAVEALGDALGSDDPDALPPLAEAIMLLLEADSPERLQSILQLYPFLLDESMDAGLAGLAEAATDQGEFEIGQAFERARITLTQLRITLDRATQQPSNPPAPAQPELPPPPAGWREAVGALRVLQDSAELPLLLERYPVLGAAHADGWLAEDERSLRDVGDLAAAQTLAEARALLRGERG